MILIAKLCIIFKDVLLYKKTMNLASMKSRRIVPQRVCLLAFDWFVL